MKVSVGENSNMSILAIGLAIYLWFFDGETLKSKKYQELDTR
jgi:hypothetical protein